MSEGKYPDMIELKLHFAFRSSQIRLFMKKYIDIKEASELLDSIARGKRVEGVLFRDVNTGCLTFKAYKRKYPKRRTDRVLRYLEHGWVKESVERIKVYESIPKVIGTPKVLATLERETKEATLTIIDNALDLDD